MQKKVSILIIKISLFCILQYISNISTRKHSFVHQGQEVYIFQSPSCPGMGDTFRRRTWCSHISPPSRPRPRTRSRPCTRRSISSACFAGARSTALPCTRPCTPGGTPSWSSGRPHSPAAFGSNLLSVPLDRRFLDHSCPLCIHCCIHSRAVQGPRACIFRAYT